MIGIGRPTTHSYLTALSPIEYRADDPENRIASVRRALAAHDPQHSPFASCPMAHMVRLQVIDRLKPRMGDRTGKQLHSTYLVFVAELDGDEQDFIDCLYRMQPEFVHSVWGRCIDYPRYTGEVFFRRFINRSRMHNALPYAGFDMAMPDVLRALARQRLYTDWVTAAQSMTPKQRKASWAKLRDKIIDPGELTPGSLQFVAQPPAQDEQGGAA